MRIAISCEMDYLANPQMRRSLCNQDYVDFVKIAGCSPYIVCEGMDIASIVDDMDGLLLSGGKDISPLLYGEDLEWNGARKCNIYRDTFERDLYYGFIDAGKPVFGICRGFQIIGLMAHEELRPLFRQDINKMKTVSQLHQQDEIVGDNPVHLIEVRGVLEKLIGSKVLAVNSFHHQGFALQQTTSDMNGWIHQDESIFCWARSREQARILEAFGMYVDGVRVAGVQYHPERMMRREKDRDKHLALFKYTMGLLDVEDEVKPSKGKMTSQGMVLSTTPFDKNKKSRS